VREMCVGPMAAPDIGELASAVLAGPVSRMLVHRLEHESEGRAGDAVRLLRAWAARGSIVWTSAGLEVVSSDAGWEEEHSFARVLRELQRQMSHRKAEVMQALALLARPVTAADLAPLWEAADPEAADPDAETDAGFGPDDIQVLLDQLSDEGVLRVGHRGHEFRHPGLRDAATAWMRPSARHRLYRRLVECGLVGDDVRETA